MKIAEYDFPWNDSIYLALNKNPGMIRVKIYADPGKKDEHDTETNNCAYKAPFSYSFHGMLFSRYPLFNYG